MFTKIIDAAGDNLISCSLALSSASASAAREALTLGYVDVSLAQKSRMTAEIYDHVIRAIMAAKEP
jgi:hypothetical protein